MEQLDDLKLDTAEPVKPSPSFKNEFSKMISDMKFVGLFVIIYGGFSCLTIIGAIIGVPMIMAGLRIREAADQFAIFRSTNSTGALKVGFELQGRYLRIFKIIIIVGLVITVLYIVAIFLFLSTFIGAFSKIS